MKKKMKKEKLEVKNRKLFYSLITDIDYFLKSFCICDILGGYVIFAYQGDICIVLQKNFNSIGLISCSSIAQCL